MRHLVHFSLHFDSFDELVHTLADNCLKTLKVLDVEHSLAVTDDSIGHIGQFARMTDLNIFGCGFSCEGQAKLLLNSPTILNLCRGDFLCDALEWVEW